MKEFDYKNIYYRKNNFKENCPTIVFIHGLSGSSSAWIPYEKKFEEKYNMVSLDLRGHGKSIKYPKYTDYEMKKMAEDVKGLLEYLNINKCILISHSLGTFVVFEFMILFSQKVSKLIFLSPNYYIKNRIMSHIIRPLLWPAPFLDIFPFTSKRGIHVDYEKYLYKADFDFRRMYEDISNTYLRIYLYCIRQLYDLDYEYLLDKINIPTLIIHGKLDTIFPIKSAIILSEKIVNSKLVILEKGNHLTIFNNFSEVSHEIEKFIGVL